MPGPRTRRIIRAREEAEREGRDADQVERDLRQEMDMAPLDRKDKEQRKERGLPEHPALRTVRTDRENKERLIEERMATPPSNGDEEGVIAPRELIELAKSGAKLTDYQRVKRDASIIQLVKRGITPEQAGAQFGLGPRQAQRVVKKYENEAPDLTDIDPAALVRSTLWNYDAAIEELALLASKTDHGPTKVGAIRVRLEALRGRIELLQSVGQLPHDLGQIRVLDDAQLVARRIAEIFDAHGVSEEVQFAVIDAIEGREPVEPALVGAGTEVEAEVEDAEIVEDGEDE